MQGMLVTLNFLKIVAGLQSTNNLASTVEV